MVKDSILCHQYLQKIYNELEISYPTPVPKGYGEILFQGVSKLISKMALTEHDIFMDLGSGKGKLGLQTFLQTPVKEIFGIELATDLTQQAQRATQKIRTELPLFFDNRNLTFINANFLNYPFNKITVAFINSTFFSQQTLNDLGNLLNETSSLLRIFSLRPIATLNQFTFKNTFRLECSWDTALCYVYQRI